MPSDSTTNRSAQECLSRLMETVSRVGQDDLSELAQMHGWLQDLSASQPGESALAQQATELTGALEQLILGETADASAALASIADSIRGLIGLVPETSVTAEASIAEEQSSAHADAIVPPPAAPAPSADPWLSTVGPQADPMPSPDTVRHAEESGAGDGTVQEAYQSVPLTIGDKEMEFVQGFVEEAGEHIEAIEAALLEVERTPADTAKIDNLFRPFHTIKGLAGFLNLRDINCLTHEVETLLDQARKGNRSVTPGLIDLVFDVVDIVKVQVAAIGRHLIEPAGDVIPQPPVSDMIGRLRDVVAGRLTPEQIKAPADPDAQRTGDLLVSQGVAPREVVDFAVQMQETSQGRKTGELLIEMGAATARQVNQALRNQGDAGREPAAAGPAVSPLADRTVRIDTAKLDALVDMVGELVIAHTLVNAHSFIRTDPKLAKDVDQVTKIVRDVQETAMAMRMVPIGSTFQKMERLVRDLSRKAGKQVELSISGQDTELDKNVIQQISDPLVHMVRNAVDHGIESPEARVAAGKDPVGHLHLTACHQSGNVVIEITDDGKGLDPAALIAKGIERGLVSPGSELTDQQAFALIFAPGFSTAQTITDISGRGVGMDVVRRNIEQLRGRIEINSEKGMGTTFSIVLPLTLAIIDGMVVRVGRERFIIPTINIQQALRPTRKQITTIQHRGEVVEVRGQFIPLIQLGQAFGLSGRTDPCEAMVVIAHCDGQPVGVVVEELIGQQQVVIKALGERFEALRGISGAAILGDGRVGLILEPSAIASTGRVAGASAA
ncbi:MAG: hypothetical protein AMXMBFR13_19970 [Phycisphaerae bacterium]